MAVDLVELIPRLRAEVNPPGVDLYPDATDDEFLLHMQNGFWETVLDGLIVGYSVDDDGLVTQVGGTTDLAAEYQQMVILYAGMKIVRNLLLNTNTKEKYVAGPVSSEVEKSANTLREILLDMRARKNLLLERLSDMGMTPAYVVDGVYARDAALFDATFGYTENIPWASAGNGEGRFGNRYGRF